MPTYSQLVKMNYKEFVSEKQNRGADTNTMISAAMARLERVLERFDRTSSILAKVNISVAVLLAIVAILHLVIFLRCS